MTWTAHPAQIVEPIMVIAVVFGHRHDVVDLGGYEGAARECELAFVAVSAQHLSAQRGPFTSMPQLYLRAEHLISRSGVKASRLAEPTVAQVPDF